MLAIKTDEKYQMFYLKKAINELVVDISIIESIKEDHINGCNYINSIKLPLILFWYLRYSRNFRVFRVLEKCFVFVK